MEDCDMEDGYKTGHRGWGMEDGYETGHRGWVHVGGILNVMKFCSICF